MISPRYIIGFAGHREIADAEAAAKAIRSALQRFRDRAAEARGEIELFTSIAYGGDTLAVEVARDMGIPAHIVLPKPVETDDVTGLVEISEGFAADFWTKQPDGTRAFRQTDWDRAWKQINDARFGVDGGTLRMVNGSQSDPDCYYDAGIQVLDGCDAMIVLWDGKAAHGRGGTGDVIKHARQMRQPKPVILIDTATFELGEENCESFARTDEPQLQEITALNALCPARAAPASAGDVFEALDTTANQASATFRSTVVLSIFLHGGATVLAGFAAVLPKGEAWTGYTLVSLAAVELVLVTYAWWLSRHHAKQHTHDQWLEARFGAELLRGLRVAAAFLDPLAPQVERHSPRWRRFALTAGLLAAREIDRRKTWRDHRNDYATARVDDQLRHFAKKQKAAKKVVSRTENIAKLATRIAPWCVLFSLCYKFFQVVWSNTAAASSGPDLFSWGEFSWDISASFLPIVIPLVAGIANGLRSALDATRRTHRYAEMQERLEAVSRGLRDLDTESSARRVIVSTEEVLLDELIEWHLAEQQNRSH